mgnify:CR=1 FL=1
MENQTQERTQAGAKKLPVWLIVVAAAVLIAVVFTVYKAASKDASGPEVITISTLEKIINVSELSTFTAVYNGIAEVSNPKKPEEIDYYVSYEARVDAGIDFEKILISMDNEAKTVTVDIPEVYITDINVDIASLDFIFINDGANTSTVTQEAFKACEADVQAESEQKEAIYDLAKQNAVNVLTALIHPILEQLDTEYALTID